MSVRSKSSTRATAVGRSNALGGANADRARVALVVLAFLSACSAHAQRRAALPVAPAQSRPAADVCSARVAKWQALQSAISAVEIAERIAKIRAASSEIGEDTEGCVVAQIEGAIEEELRKAITLEVNNQRYQALVVYTCHELREDSRCAGRRADDTNHLREAPGPINMIPAGASARIKLAAGFPLKSVQLYVQDSYNATSQSIVPRKVDSGTDGVVRLPANEQPVPFFVVAHDSDNQVHKWIWLVQGK